MASNMVAQVPANYLNQLTRLLYPKLLLRKVASRIAGFPSAKIRPLSLFLLLRDVGYSPSYR